MHSYGAKTSWLRNIRSISDLLDGASFGAEVTYAHTHRHALQCLRNVRKETVNSER